MGDDLKAQIALLADAGAEAGGALSRCGQATIDGSGARRVAAQIEALL